VRDPWCAPENRFLRGTYRARNIRTRPRLWWPSVGFGYWASGLCAVCASPCGGDMTYWYHFEEGAERMCRFCHDWAKALLSY
jgi:hypothetical protein